MFSLDSGTLLGCLKTLPMNKKMSYNIFTSAVLCVRIHIYKHTHIHMSASCLPV